MGSFRALKIKAGPRAMVELRRDGLRAERIRALIGASGGPKFLGLIQLDRAILEHLLTSDARQSRSEPIEMLGSSIGAWRYACYGQQDPLAAFQRFEDSYFAFDNPVPPTVDALTHESRVVLKAILGETGIDELLSNTAMRLAISTVRARGWAASTHDLKRVVGLTAAGLGNAISKRALGLHFDRVIFHTGEETRYADLADFRTCAVPLEAATVFDALMATIAIPYVFAPVHDIEGAPPGMYCDGGIIDYHFDVPFWPGDGLVLYPHFADRMVPGWFDKALKWRKPKPHHTDNVILISPSPAMLERLPFGKIPDRGDFKKLSDDDRRTYWRSVLDETRAMGDELAELCQSGAWDRAAGLL